MSDFLIKGAIIVFGFVPLGVAVAVLTVCLMIESTKAELERGGITDADGKPL